MAEVERLLRTGAIVVAPEEPNTNAARWCLGQYYAELAARFDNGFDQICGDTFCEGDYADIDALGFECAVSTAGNVKNCALSLAGAYTEVGSYGVITAHTKTWSCPIPATGKKAVLQTFMAGSDPYNAPLPGQTTTIHDALVNCL